MHRSLFILASILLTTSLLVAQSTTPKRGIVGKPAPPLVVDQWVHTPESDTPPSLETLRGDVIVLFFFQSWCPGCHSSGFPTLQHLADHFDGTERVHFIAVQTAFEGHQSNTPSRAASTVKQYDLEIPVGHAGSEGNHPRLMRDFRSGGTPWLVIIGPDGTVVSDGFRIESSRAVKVIDQLLEQPVVKKNTIPTLDPGRGGQDLVGTKAGQPKLKHWARPTSPAAETTGKTSPPRLTLYRWWTDTCPYCEGTLPAIETLRKKYEARGLRTVGVYHPKPPRPVTDEAILASAKAWGYTGPVAVDENWAALNDYYLDRGTGDRPATSVTLLVDAEGRIRFIHPGPVFHPSDDPDKAQEDSDFKAIDLAIDALLPPLKKKSEDNGD